MKPFPLSLPTFFRTLPLASVLLAAVLADGASAGFAEFPQSRGVLASELEYRTSELASCGPKARCAFLKAYAGYLGERTRTLTESADPLAYLSKYPEEIESRIRDYEDSIEFEFDGRFARWFAEWQMRDVSVGRERPYEDYVAFDALPKLLREYRAANTAYEKAAAEVGIRYLLSDVTLLSRQCAE